MEKISNVGLKGLQEVWKMGLVSRDTREWVNDSQSKGNYITEPPGKPPQRQVPVIDSSVSELSLEYRQTGI